MLSKQPSKESPQGLWRNFYKAMLKAILLEKSMATAAILLTVGVVPSLFSGGVAPRSPAVLNLDI